MQTIAVSGATGQLGQLIITRLKAHMPAENLIALARDTGKAQALGVNVRLADYNRPDTLDAALQGVDTLMMISGSEVGQRIRQHQNLIDAARKAGVKRVVYTSLLRADRSPLSVAREHPETEAYLQASGLAYTILRNGWYHENYTGSVPAALANRALYGSAGNGKISSAARADYADAAVAVLLGDGHDGKTYELAGDHAYTLAELAAEISRQSGQEIPYVDISESDYAAALADAGVPADFAALIAGWDTDAKNGALYSEDRTLSQLIKRPTTPIADSVRAALAG